jgi:hypothetical protein
MNACALRSRWTIRRLRRPRHSGVTLIEVSVSILLVAALGSLLAQALVSRAGQQRSIEHRELAVVEAGNLMEQMTALPWNDLTQERLAQFTLSDNLRRAIPAAKLDVAIEPAAEKPEARRISISIDYPGPGGQPARATRLTSWVYRIEPAAAASAAVAPEAKQAEVEQSKVVQP